MSVRPYFLSQTMADIPAESSWLSPEEFVRAAEFRFAKRRSDWLLGRWTAKCAVQRLASRSGVSVELASIEIRSAPDGAPEPYIANERAPVSLSLSHSRDESFVVVAEAGVPLGCDLERIEPRSPEFLLDYFTEQERALVEAAPKSDRAVRCTLIWSAKESALKWLREGLRLDTRSVCISLGDSQPDWSPLTATCREQLTGWWRKERDFIQTIVARDLLMPSPLL